MGHHIWNDRKQRVEYAPDIFERAVAGMTGWMGGGLDIMAGGIGVILKAFFVVFLIGIALYLAYIILADAVLGQLGIVKAKSQLTVVLPQEISEEQASIVSVSHQKKPVVGEFAIENGQSTVKTSTHNQSLYLSYDGLLEDCGYYASTSIVEPISPVGEFQTNRAVLVTVCDADGNALHGENIKVRASDASSVRGAVLDDGRLSLLLPEDAKELTITFAADGYADEAVCMDWNSCRLGKLEVYLHAQ